MQNTPLTINLTQDWSLYAMTTPDNIIGAKSSGDAPKGMLLPSPTLERDAIAQQLDNDDKKQQLHESIQADNPQPHFLGMLQFTNEIEAVVKEVAIVGVEEEEAWDIEEHIVLTLQDGQAAVLDTIQLNLAVFDAISGDAPLAEADIERLDAQLLFLDEEGKHLHRQTLGVHTSNGLENSVVYNLGKVVSNAREANSKSGKKLNGILDKVKKIVVVIKRIWGKIKKAVANLKKAALPEIIKKIRFIKNRLMDNPYKVLSYDFAAKEFRKIGPSAIDSNKRTLILLHGTLKGSFDGRIGRHKKGKGSFKFLHNFQINEGGVTYTNWFDYLKQKSSDVAVKYEQILSLEHETILDGPKENIVNFIKEWDIRLTQPVSIICASRGSLLAKCMAAHKDILQRMTIDRIAIVSGGYSDYFDTEHGVAAYVKMHREFLPRRAYLFLEAILEVIPQLPGLEVQCKENDSFKEFTEADRVPPSSKSVIYYNMTNKFPINRNPAMGEVAKQFLGKENDLALSFIAQEDYRPGLNHTTFPPFQGEEKHGEGLRLLKPKQQLFNFLTSDLHTVV